MRSSSAAARNRLGVNHWASSVEVIGTPSPEAQPLQVDLSLLRSVSWGDCDLFVDPGTISIGMARLRKLGLVERRSGQWVTTPDGETLLDDDF